MGKGRDRRKKNKAKNERARQDAVQQEPALQEPVVRPDQQWDGTIIQSRGTKFYDFEERKAS